jgi:hypothetical protein
VWLGRRALLRASERGAAGHAALENDPAAVSANEQGSHHAVTPEEDAEEAAHVPV